MVQVVDVSDELERRAMQPRPAVLADDVLLQEGQRVVAVRRRPVLRPRLAVDGPVDHIGRSRKQQNTRRCVVQRVQLRPVPWRQLEGIAHEHQEVPVEWMLLLRP